jgi:chromate reductase
MEVSARGYPFFASCLHSSLLTPGNFLFVTRILAVSGSLRAHSTNTTVLLAAARLTPPGVQIELYKGLGDLPLFNPDLDDDAPAVVRRFQAALAAADGILICSPEYAHGVSGAMKNALDWLVSDVNLVAKPVALINASPRATIAHDALLETLRTMSWKVVAEASRTVPVPRPGMSADEILGDEILRTELTRAIEKFVDAVSPSDQIPQ